VIVGVKSQKVVQLLLDKNGRITATLQNSYPSFLRDCYSDPEQWSFIDKCPAEVAALPLPHGPLTVGIDGGYVKAQGEQDAFEVIAGKSLLAFHRREEAQEPVSSKCFAFV
jgi:hypothetical protein